MKKNYHIIILLTLILSSNVYATIMESIISNDGVAATVELGVLEISLIKTVDNADYIRAFKAEVLNIRRLNKAKEITREDLEKLKKGNYLLGRDREKNALIISNHKKSKENLNNKLKRQIRELEEIERPLREQTNLSLKKLVSNIDLNHINKYELKEAKKLRLIYRCSAVLSTLLVGDLILEGIELLRSDDEVDVNKLHVMEQFINRIEHEEKFL